MTCQSLEGNGRAEIQILSVCPQAHTHNHCANLPLFLQSKIRRVRTLKEPMV